MEFNSQICTTKNQSDRLLALGLKKETADMCYQVKFFDLLSQNLVDCTPLLLTRPPINNERFIPAWSLHRLIEVLGVSKMAFNMDIYDSPYEEIIHRIEIFVNAREFNKEYLE